MLDSTSHLTWRTMTQMSDHRGCALRDFSASYRFVNYTVQFMHVMIVISLRLCVSYRSGANRKRLKLRAGGKGAICHWRRLCNGSRFAQHAPGALPGEGWTLCQNGPHQWDSSAQAHPSPELCRSVMLIDTRNAGLCEQVSYCELFKKLYIWRLQSHVLDGSNGKSRLCTVTEKYMTKTDMENRVHKIKSERQL